LVEKNNTYQLIQKLAEREGVSEEKIKEIIINSFSKNYYQKESNKAELHFEFDKSLLVYRKYKIVVEVSDAEKEITKDNKLLKKGKIEGEVFYLPLDTANFSLSPNFKEQLQKDLGGIHTEKQYSSFKPLEGQLIQGSVQNIQENYYLVNLGKGIGY
jgi:hypothetical protein